MLYKLNTLAVEHFLCTSAGVHYAAVSIIMQHAEFVHRTTPPIPLGYWLHLWGTTVDIPGVSRSERR